MSSHVHSLLIGCAHEHLKEFNAHVTVNTKARIRQLHMTIDNENVLAVISLS